ncbi:maltotransferase domain-containing protein, partial [Streptomyces sp. Tue6028]|uniref:maltotransferase domain-containing protein n=1 Tax=Streptomyces sp. Tue6028 TaxID=2036037 RepID=UPI003D74B501
MPATHQTSPPPTSTPGTSGPGRPGAGSRTTEKPATAAEDGSPVAENPAAPAEGMSRTAEKPPAPAESMSRTTEKPPAPAESMSRTTEKPPAPAESMSRTTEKPPALAAEPAVADDGTADTSRPTVGRIPVLDVRPLVHQGRRPAKAVVGEAFEISATVFREGHDAVAANVVLRDPDGHAGPWAPMRELAPGTDRWGATVTAGQEGRWTYTVEAWSDPVTTWRHHAGIKIPAGMDTELVLEEGARLYERAAAQVPKSKGRRDTLLRAVDALRDVDRPAAARLAAALTPEVDAVLARRPLRELVSSSEPLPLLVERERALYGSWYEFFPRSESGRSGSDP